MLRRFGDSVTAETIDELCQLEASAAALYFGAWSGRAECAPTFTSKDRHRIPPHWSRERRAPLGARVGSLEPQGGTTGERGANYLYSLRQDLVTDA